MITTFSLIFAGYLIYRECVKSAAGGLERAFCCKKKPESPRKKKRGCCKKGSPSPYRTPPPGVQVAQSPVAQPLDIGEGYSAQEISISLSAAAVAMEDGTAGLPQTLYTQTQTSEEEEFSRSSRASVSLASVSGLTSQGALAYDKMRAAAAQWEGNDLAQLKLPQTDLLRPPATPLLVPGSPESSPPESAIDQFAPPQFIDSHSQLGFPTLDPQFSDVPVLMEGGAQDL